MASASGVRYRLYPLLAVLCCVLLSSSPAQEKKLTIYAPAAGYSVAVTERDGRDYVAIAEVLQPLGAVAVTTEGTKIKMSFTPAGAAKSVEVQFTNGKSRAIVGGKNVELASGFLTEGARSLFPVRSLPPLLARLLDAQIEFHTAGRRLFVGNAAVRYSAELKKAPARLVLSFSAPVTPSIATGPGGLRMVFTRDALVAANEPQAFEDHTISAVRFSETNGTAELLVAANVPLTASSSDGGRTITVTGVLPPAPPTPAATQSSTVPALPQPTPAVPEGPKFLVVIDPGHGGAESGAALGDLAEKDFNLGFARRLRAELEGRGIHTMLLRDGDISLSFGQRTLSVNGVNAAVYIAIHATASGAGVRVYTSDLAPAAKRRAFLPIDRVQAAYVNPASLFANSIVAELEKRRVGAAAEPAPVRPLNNVAAAAVAIEVAPPENDARGLASAVYQQSICSAVGAALAASRARLGGPR